MKTEIRSDCKIVVHVIHWLWTHCATQSQGIHYLPHVDALIIARGYEHVGTIWMPGDRVHIHRVCLLYGVYPRERSGGIAGVERGENFDSVVTARGGNHAVYA